MDFYFLGLFYTLEGQFHLLAELGQMNRKEFLKEDFNYLVEAFSTQLWNISLMLQVIISASYP